MIEAGAVTSTKIAAGAITTDKLAANCITTNIIQAALHSADEGQIDVGTVRSSNIYLYDHDSGQYYKITYRADGQVPSTGKALFI